MVSSTAPRLPELVEPAPRGRVPSPTPASGRDSLDAPGADLAASSAPVDAAPAPAHVEPAVVANLARRDLPAAGRQPAAAARAGALDNPRFAGLRRLERAASGTSCIGRGGRGAAVRQLQQALIDLGHYLPSGADARFGEETRRAVRAFQRQHGLEADGLVGRDTLLALDRAAPPPGQRIERYPDYQRLLADGVLDVALAVGYDEHGAHLPEMQQLQAGLAERGFARVDLERGATASLREKGIDPARLQAGAAYYHREVVVAGRPRQVVVRLITPQTPAPKASFAQALDGSDAVFYGGHARYGTGPDFDHIESDRENFVIGARGQVHRQRRARPGYSPQMNRRLQRRSNDLEARRYGADRYQLWLFSGCTTAHYLDELRTVDFGKRSGDLDVMGTTRPLYWSHTAEGGLSFLDGLIAGRSADQLRRSLDAQNHAEGAFFADGFADNPTRPR